MNISPNGIKLIEDFEEFVSCPYQDQIDVWTIGYGTTFYPNGKRVTEHDPCITKDEAASYMLNYLLPVVSEINEIVQTQINQNQFDALCDFSYNLGVDSLKISTLLKLINLNPNDPNIKDQFLRWDHRWWKST